MDDLRVGRIARVLRQRLRLRQVDVGARSGVGRDVVHRIEHGRIGGMTVRTLRAVFAAFDAEVVVIVRWRGGELDRLVDRRHAQLGGRFTTMVHHIGWGSAPEVTYSEFGERGAIDALAWNPATRTLLVVEVKTELTSIEETLRRHDAKCRLAPRIARDRFGWDAADVARVLVLADTRTNRRAVGRHEALLSRVYPVRGRELPRWFRRPAGSIGGLLFLTDSGDVGGSHGSAPIQRVRRARTGPERPHPAGNAAASKLLSADPSIGERRPD